jgi:hypothetical protein
MTQMRAEYALGEITKHLRELNTWFKIVESLEHFEEYAKSGEDKRAGRNRLRLSYGRE